MTRYDTMTIDQLSAIVARLSAAYGNPRTANRSNVGNWLIDATYALMTARGEVV